MVLCILYKCAHLVVFLSLTTADASIIAVSTKTESSTGTAAATTTTEGVLAEGSEAEQEDMLGEELGRYLLTEEEQQKRYCTYLTLPCIPTASILMSPCGTGRTIPFNPGH